MPELSALRSSNAYHEMYARKKFFNHVDGPNTQYVGYMKMALNKNA